MIFVDCSVAWLKVAYSTISRCTRAASLCSVSRNVCSSVMSLSIPSLLEPDRCAFRVNVVLDRKKVLRKERSRGHPAPRAVERGISPASAVAPGRTFLDVRYGCHVADVIERTTKVLVVVNN